MQRNVAAVSLQQSESERPDSADLNDFQTSVMMSEADKASSDRKLQALEKAMAFMRKQHRDLVVGLQEEVEKLKEENRGT